MLDTETRLSIKMWIWFHFLKGNISGLLREKKTINTSNLTNKLCKLALHLNHDSAHGPHKGSEELLYLALMVLFRFAEPLVLTQCFDGVQMFVPVPLDSPRATDTPHNKIWRDHYYSFKRCFFHSYCTFFCSKSFRLCKTNRLYYSVSIYVLPFFIFSFLQPRRVL